MPVLSGTTWRVHPGRNAEFAQAASEAKQIHERLGATVTMAQWSSAGAASGSLVYAVLLPDFPTWGRFVDALVGDAEWQGWAAKYMGADAPGTVLSQNTLTDVPGFDQPETVEPGSFLLAMQASLAPGHTTADVVSIATEASEIAKDLGAKWVRVFRAGAGGETTLRYSVLFAFDNASDYGDWQAKYTADPRGQANSARAFGPGSPFADQMLLYGRVMDI